MSVKVYAMLNPFSTERKEFEFKTDTLSSILRKIDSHATESQWRVLIDDEIVTDFSKTPEDGKTLYVKLIPGNDQHEAGTAMKGGGVLLTALGIAASFIPFAGAFLGPALIGAGIGCFLSGVVIYNFQVPTVKERKTPEQDPSLRGSRNQSRLFSPVPILLGRRRIYCDNAMASYTWVDPETGAMYLNQLFCLGQKDMVVDKNSIKIEETALADYSSSGNIDQILSGEDSLINMQIAYGERIPPLMDKCVHEIQMQSVLKHKTDTGDDGSIIRTTPDKTEEINVDIFFYSGLGQYNDDGDLISASVKVTAWYKQADADDSTYQKLGHFLGSSDILRAAELKTKRYAITKSGLSPDRYTIKITRETPDHTDNKIIDTVYVGSIRAIKNMPPIRPEVCERLTIVGFRVKASDKLQNVVEQLNMVAQSCLPSFTTKGAVDWNTLVPSSNPAACAIYAMQGNLVQQKLSDGEIDLRDFARLFAWCDEHEYECNAYVTDSMPIKELLDAIASTCRAEIFRRNGKITVVQDIERSGFTQMFTPRNSWGFKETIELPAVPDCLKLEFDDCESGFAPNECCVYNTPNGNKIAEPSTNQKIDLWGVTGSAQARKLGMYKYAVTKHRGSVYQFSADFEYLMCGKGDWIKYAGDIALTGISQGRIEEVIYNDNGMISGFVLDEACPMTEDKLYGIRIRKNDGEAVLYELSETILSNDHVVYLAEPSSRDNGICEGCLFMFGERGSESIDLIITDIQCGENLSADLVCVEYAPEIFGVDDPSFILPEYTNKLSEISSVIDNGMVTLENWQTFTTYHDSTGLPAAPKGNGASDGWHRNMTSHTRWMSQKTAPTIYDGIWSEPVATTENQILGLIDGTTAISQPDVVTGVTAVAYEDKIKITWNALNSGKNGLRNSVQFYTVKIYKNTNIPVVFTTVANEIDYIFDRESDGYPEATTLDAWYITVRATNGYGVSSEQESAAAYIDTENYGSWQLTSPTIHAEPTARLCVITCSLPQRSDGRTRYGKIRYSIQIKRLGVADPGIDPSADSVLPDEDWYKPSQASDPTTSALNYREGMSGEFASFQEKFTQYLPLIGQDTDPKKCVNTKYQYRVCATNEAGSSEWSEPIVIIATCQLVSDIVHSHEYYKDLYVEALSAINANMGSITSGSLSSPIVEGEEKPRVLLDLTNEEFRVGNNPKLEESDSDDAFYLHYKKGSLSARFASFIIKAMSSIISGVFAVRNKAGKKENFLVVNPESTTDTDSNAGLGSGIPAKTARLKGEFQSERIVIAPDSYDTKTLVDHYEWECALRDREIPAANLKNIYFGRYSSVFWSEIQLASDSSELMDLNDLAELLQPYLVDGEEGHFIDTGHIYLNGIYVRPDNAERIYADDIDDTVIFAKPEDGTGNLIYTAFVDLAYDYWEKLNDVPPTESLSFVPYNMTKLESSDDAYYVFDNTSKISSLNNNYVYLKCITHTKEVKDPLPEESNASFVVNGIVTAKKIYGEFAGSISPDGIRTLFDIIYPVGYVYPQYPAEKSPNEMWGDFSAWEEIDFGGAFFRASGGNALNFELSATVASIDETNRAILYMDDVYADIKQGCILYDPNSNNSWLVSKNETVNSVSKVTLATTVSESITLTNLIIGQEDSLLEHKHNVSAVVWKGNVWGNDRVGYGGGGGWTDQVSVTVNGVRDSRYNANENRVVNFTYILWKRIS